MKWQVFCKRKWKKGKRKWRKQKLMSQQSVLKHKSALLESCSPLQWIKVYRIGNVPINCTRKEKISKMFTMTLYVLSPVTSFTSVNQHLQLRNRSRKRVPFHHTIWNAACYEGTPLSIPRYDQHTRLGLWHWVLKLHPAAKICETDFKLISVRWS